MVAPQMPPQQQMPQGQPQMPPQQAQQRLPEDSGIGQLPAQNMQGMADGGIVGYAEGGVPRFNGMTGSVPQLGYEELAKLYAKDPALAKEAALRAGPASQRIFEGIRTAGRAGMVPGAVLEGGVFASGKALSDLAKYTTPEQRQEMSSNPMLSAMSGDAGAAAATMDAKRNNPSGPSTTPYLTQMKNVAGAGIDALGAMGKHLISAPGYGFSSMSKPGEVEPGRVAMPQSTISGTGDTTEIDNLAAQMQAEKAKTKPTTTGTTGGQPTKPSAGANAGRPAGGGITALSSEADAIKRYKDALGTAAEPTVNKTDFLKELGDISKPAFDKANALVDKEKTRLKEGKDQDFYMALIEGGLAAAGETGPDGLQNLAKGFSKGAASYRDALKDFRKATQENAKMEVELARADAADKKGDLKSYYDHQEKALERKSKKDDRIAAGISSIITTTEQGKFGLEAARINREGHVAAAGISANAQRNLMEALGNAEPDSALRKGFDLQKTIAQQAALYEQYQKMLMDPATGMERPDVRKMYPNFQTYLAEYEKALANKGAPGGGIKTIADPSKVQQPVLQR
jgi:hypothetical protein